MLKYAVEAQCEHELGDEECRRLIAEQRERLLCRGFDPTELPPG